MAGLRGVRRPAGLPAAGGVRAGQVAGGQVLRDDGVLLGGGAVWDDGGEELWRADGGEAVAGSV